QFKKLWERWGNYILAAAIVVVLAIAGWRAWDWWETKKAQQAGAAFGAAPILVQSGKPEGAGARFVQLAGGAAGRYRTPEQVGAAGELAGRDAAAAVKAYDGIAADARVGRVLQDLAALRAGLLLVDSAPLNEIQSRLEPLTAADRPFRHSARELIALAAWHAGDVATARRWFD